MPKDVISTSIDIIENSEENINSLNENKSDLILRNEANRLSNLKRYIQNNFGVNKKTIDSEIAPLIKQLSEQIQKNGTIDQATYNSVFDRIWNSSTYTDSTMSDMYSSLANDLKRLNLNIKDVKKHLGNMYNDFKEDSRGILGLRNGGRSIDSKYDELSSEYPELFPSDIINPADQLYTILDVANVIQPRQVKLNTITDEDFRYGYQMEFYKKLNSYLDEMVRIEQIHQERMKSKNKEKPDLETLSNLASQKHTYESKWNSMIGKSSELFSEKEKSLAKDIAAGKYTLDDINQKSGVRIEKVKELLDTYKPYHDSKEAHKLYKKMIKSEKYEQASEMIKGMFGWKTSDNAGLYKLLTPERVFRTMVGTEEEADAMIKTYIDPIHKNTALSTKFKNEIRNRIKSLNLSNLESQYVQRLGEGDVTIEDITAAGLDPAKIQHAVNEFRAVYDQCFEMVNDALTRNGYDPIDKKENYFPHFEEIVQHDGFIGKVLGKLGIEVQSGNLGTSIAGITDTFTPGKAWSGNLQHRTTEKTQYDALVGLDGYLESVSDVIFHTDDIQRLRALEHQIRYENSADGIKEAIDKINDDPKLKEEERYEAINKKLDEYKITNQFDGFITWLHEYANKLANKKSIDDRVVEQNIGRVFYSAVKGIEGRVASNMIAGNLSSYSTNLIPLAQATGECSLNNLGKAMQDTAANMFGDNDGFKEASTFLTNRIGSDPFTRKTDIKYDDSNVKKVWKKYLKLGEKAMIPMEFIDHTVSEIVTRAKYYQNLENGMNEFDALENADKYTAGLIADRSKGALPLYFESSNPLIKLFTQFQLEGSNQFQYLFMDLPKNVGKEAASMLAAAVAKIFLSSWLINNLYEKFIGRRPAFDPVQLIIDFITTIHDDKLDVSDKVVNIGESVIQEIPFVGSLFGGGRLPLSSAFPSDITQIPDLLSSDVDDRKKLDIIYNQIYKPLSYVAMPFGASQINKIGSGLHDYIGGAAYTYSKDGERLRYTVDQNPANLVRALIMGSSSFPEAQEFWDSEYKIHSVKDTDAFQLLKDDYGSQGALDKIYELKAIESVRNDKGEVVTNSKEYLIKAYIDKLNISRSEKLKLYEAYLSKKFRNKTTEELREIKANIDKAR